jgi:predicted metal-dependent hydrolase
VSAQIPFSVRRVPRSRRLKVRVDAQRGVEVLLPPGAPLRSARAAVDELAPWIERQLADRERARARLHRAGSVPYLDGRLCLAPEAGRTRAHRRGEQLAVPEDDAAAAIERWFRRAAREEIGRRLDTATAAVGSRYRRLEIRNQRTRWASCASDGTMSFNWRLLLGPERVLDYVVWHEVCHLDVADHSPRFWSLLESRCPDWRERARWLRENGAALVL